MTQLKSNIMIYNVPCVMPYICIAFKTNNATPKSCFCYRTVLFPVIQRYCSADVKIVVVSFTFARKKLTRTTPKYFANLSSCQHSNKLAYLLYLETGDIQTCSLHSVVGFYLAVNVTLITNSKSNSEQTNKSVCYESDEIINNFWKKPACRLSLHRWKYYYSSKGTGNQAVIELVQ